MIEYRLTSNNYRTSPNHNLFLPEILVDGLGTALLIGNKDMECTNETIQGIAIVDGHIIKKPAMKFEEEGALTVNVEFKGIRARGPFSLLTIASHPLTTLVGSLDLSVHPDLDGNAKTTFGHTEEWQLPETPQKYHWYSYPECQELDQFRFRFQWLRNLTEPQSP